eukprot:499123_1
MTDNTADFKDEYKHTNTNEIPLYDAIYEFNDKKNNELHKAKPWKKDPIYFKKCQINALAATKMVKHAVNGVHQGRKKNGLPVEVMGLLVGRHDTKNTDTIIIMDCIELPVEGSEARVVADDEKVLGFMTRMQDRIEELRKDRFIGWYHSHPFEVINVSHCWYSNIDISNQLMWQLQFGKWVGIVIDPLRCLSKQKIDLRAFMCFEPQLRDNVPQKWVNGLSELQKRWYTQGYYQLEHKFFMGSLVEHNLKMMNRKHLWIKQLSSNVMLEDENKEELPNRIGNVVKRMESGIGKGKDKIDMEEAMKIGTDIVIEQCIGHSMQLNKNQAFNSELIPISAQKDSIIKPVGQK